MASRLNANEWANGILSLAAMGENDFQVQVDGVPIGQIIARRRSFGRTISFWSISGPQIPESMGEAGSNAHTLDGAKAAVKHALDVWLESATGERGKVCGDLQVCDITRAVRIAALLHAKL